jgi:hypothetical protein
MSDVRSKVVLGIDVNEFRRGITQVDSSIKGISKQFQNLGGIIGASFAVSQIQQFASEALDLAMKAEGIETAFERVGNAANMQQLRQAVQGTVSDLELMRQAVTAQKLGIPIQEFTKYLGFAKKQANEMGESVDYMVDSIVKGVGRQSTMILDNLGISAKAVQEELKKGGTFAEAVGRIIQQEMGRANNTLLTTQDRLLQQRAALENIKTELGQKLLPVYEAVLGWLNNALKGINALFSSQLTLFEKLAYYGSYLDVTGMGSVTRATLDAKEATEDFAAAVPMIGEGFQGATEEVKKLGNELKKVAGIKVQGGMRLADVEPGLAPKETAVTPLYQVNQAVFGIRRQAEYAAGSWEHYKEAQAQAIRTGNDWITQSQRTEQQMQQFALIGQQLGNIFAASFEAALVSGEDFFTTLGKALKAYLQQLAATVAATAALAVVSSAFGGTTFLTAFAGVGQGTGLAGFFGGSEEFVGRVKGFELLLQQNRTNRNSSLLTGGN